MPVQKIMTATVMGINAALVEVEADVSNGLPATIIVGLPDTAVQESRERVRSAIKHSGFAFPQTRVSLNLAPGHLPKVGTHFDLPIAAAILAAGKLVNLPLQANKAMFIGELSLDGSVRSVSGVLAMTELAKQKKFTTVFVPKANSAIAALVPGITVYGVSNLGELVSHFEGRVELPPVSPTLLDGLPPPALSTFSQAEIDLANIAGQPFAKRALEIAAAGGHNILFTGPPGSGKTLLAKALAGILPPLAPSEVLELTKIYNCAGRLPAGVIWQRPVRAPHHTASSAALLGGGNVPRPGEVTLAHHGVLFLDEFPEFSRRVLEVLRQPLEDQRITITRLRHAYSFPASFILVAAQNPCPCGNFGELGLECKCAPQAIQKYRKKISGPLLDRIDLHVPVPRQTYQEVMAAPIAETSERVRQRVRSARTVQEQRLGEGKTNHQISVKELKQHCVLTAECSTLLEQAANNFQLSGRSIHRILKVARTIADLAGSEIITQAHVAESLQYRILI